MNLPDPMTQYDERLALEREVEARRMEDERQLCDLFKKDIGHAIGSCYVVYQYEPENYDWLIEPEQTIQRFAADYRWPAVYRVLATAIHEHEQLFDRR